MNTEQKQAEMDWAFADRECTKLTNMLASVPLLDQFLNELAAELEVAQNKRREIEDRMHAAAMAELARRRGELVLSTESTEKHGKGEV